MTDHHEVLLSLTGDITVAFVANNRVTPEETVALISGVYGALAALGDGTTPAQVELTVEYQPAVPPSRSIKPDHLISLIDGKPYKTLKRHLTGHGLTPDQYRERYGLKPSYPMVAPNYAEMRRDLAKKIGLGRKPGARR